MKTPVSVTIVIHIHCIVSRNDIVEYFFDKKMSYGLDRYDHVEMTWFYRVEQLYYG